MSMKHTLVNIICGLIPNKKCRSKTRIILNNPSIFKHLRWVQQWAKQNNITVKKLRVDFGVGGHNLVVLLNDAHVFKFFLVPNREQRAHREQRIVDALKDITPIPFPKMETITTSNTVIRHYEFIHGKLLTDFAPSYVAKHRKKLAKQLANFMYTVGCADPVKIRDLKPTPDTAPDFLYGWFHNDIGNNFIMDDDLNIIAFIDCEKADFCDFKTSLTNAEHFWDKHGFRGLMIEVLAQYTKLYYAQSVRTAK